MDVFIFSRGQREWLLRRCRVSRYRDIGQQKLKSSVYLWCTRERNNGRSFIWREIARRGNTPELGVRDNEPKTFFRIPVAPININLDTHIHVGLLDARGELLLNTIYRIIKYTYIQHTHRYIAAKIWEISQSSTRDII